MVFKKNVLTYIGISILALLFAGMIYLCVGALFDHDIYFSLLYGAGCILAFVLLFICTYFVSFLFGKIKSKAVPVVIELILALGIMTGVLCYKMFDIPWELSIYNGITVFLVYFIVRTGAGRAGAFLTSIILSVLLYVDSGNAVPTLRSYIGVVIFVIILLFAIYYKRCNSDKMKTPFSRVLICIIGALCGAGTYYFKMFAVLLGVIFLSMLFKAWKQALIMLGVGIISFAAVLGVYTLYTDENQFISYYESTEEKVYDVAEDLENIDISKIPDNVSDILGGISNSSIFFGYGDMVLFTIIILSFISAFIMYFGERYALLPIIFYYLIGSVFRTPKMMLYVVIFCFAYAIQGLCNIYRDNRAKKHEKVIEVVYGTVEGSDDKETKEGSDNGADSIFVDDNPYFDATDGLPVPMSLIDSVCEIKVINHSVVHTDECWEKRKLRAVVRALKKYYESEDMSNG